MNPALLAVLGYAIGTAQILFIDWWRRRRDHRRRLRLLRAELRQIHEGSQRRFGWDPKSGPASDSTPYPPRVSTEYSAVVAATDFYLTDEHDDDNTQQALLNHVDGVELLGRYHQDVFKLLDQLRGQIGSTERAELRSRCIATAESYDKEATRLEYMVESAVADMERRLAITGFKAQAVRTLRGRLPEGKNPPPLKGTDDPRLSPPDGQGSSS